MGSIQVGGFARVVNEVSNLRRNPGNAEQLILTIGVGETVSIIGGPQYLPAVGELWWKVLYGVNSGWLAAQRGLTAKLIAQAFQVMPLHPDAELPPGVEHRAATVVFPDGAPAWGEEPLPRPVRPESVAAVQQLPSLWDELDFQPLTEPGVQTYEKTIDLGPKRWGFSWWGDSPKELQHWHAALNINFVIGGYGVSEIHLLQYPNPQNPNGWVWDVSLRGWTSGSTVELDVHYVVSDNLTNVANPLPPGTYIQRIVASVR